MKICFSISGQFRDSARPLLNLIKKLHDQKHTVWVTLSTWSIAGKKTSGAFTESQLYRLFSPEFVQLIPREKLGKSFSSIIDIDSLSCGGKIGGIGDFVNFLKDNKIGLEYELINPELLDLSMEKFDYDENSLRSLYLAWRSGRLRKKIEKEHGEFDVVVKLRPDLAFSNFATESLENEISSLERRLLVPDYGERPNFAHDIYAVGDSYSVYTLEKFFGYCILHSSNWEGIHQDLHKYLTLIEKNHQIRILNSKEYGINFYISPQRLYDLEDVDLTSIRLPQLKKAVECIREYNNFSSEAYFTYSNIYELLTVINDNVNSESKLSETALKYLVITTTALIMRRLGQFESSHVLNSIWNCSCFDADEPWLKRVSNNKYFLALQYSLSTQQCESCFVGYAAYLNFLNELNLNSDSLIQRLNTRSLELASELEKNTKIVKHATKLLAK